MGKKTFNTWAELNTKLKRMTEKECLALLDIEKKGKRRLQFLLRIYGRYNKLRTIRERKEVAKG